MEKGKIYGSQFKFCVDNNVFSLWKKNRLFHVFQIIDIFHIQKLKIVHKSG